MRKNIMVVLSLVLVLLLGLITSGCNNLIKNDKEIILGANYEMTGALAAVAKQTVNGINLAIKQTNEQGGVLGKQIKLIIADNKSEPSESANAITKLIKNDNAKLVFGSVASSNVLATVQIAHDSKIPLITATATNPSVTMEQDQVRPYVFRTCFIDPFQGEVMANFAAKSLQAKNAVMYIDSSSDSSKFKCFSNSANCP